MIDSSAVMMIEPTRPASAEPVVDYNTFMAAMLFEASRPSGYAYRSVPVISRPRGFHGCICGATSDNRDHTLPGGLLTNSLIAHYAAYHREEVLGGELAKVINIFKEAFPDFDFAAFDRDEDRKRALIAAIPTPRR